MDKVINRGIDFYFFLFDKDLTLLILWTTLSISKEGLVRGIWLYVNSSSKGCQGLYKAF